jgi:hypothetical protein
MRGDPFIAGLLGSQRNSAPHFSQTCLGGSFGAWAVADFGGMGNPRVGGVRTLSYAKTGKFAPEGSLVFGFDIFGGSRRRAALALLDRTLATLEVNPAYVDDGMRFAIYKWALEAGGDTDQFMRDAAALISFCVIGAGETGELWGPEVCAAREARFSFVLANAEDETFDARIIKLVLAKGIAAPDILARATLE